MNLHDDREAFDELLIGAANELAIPTDIIEKVIMLLLRLRNCRKNWKTWFLKEEHP